MPATEAPLAVPLEWNAVATARALLRPLLTDGTVNNLIVRIDSTSPHHDGGAQYRQARFALDSSGGNVWVDATSGMRLYAVQAFVLAE